MSKRTGWGCEFDDPIELPGGRKLITLEDAGNYITKLPKAEHATPASFHLLGPPMFDSPTIAS